jgi:hypothetical protein
MVRVDSGAPDIRFRAGFPEWSATLKIEFNENVIPLERLVALVNAAGRCGIGEWRPSSPKVASGTFGMFRVSGALAAEFGG